MKQDEILFCLKKIVAPYVQNDKAFSEFNERTDFLRDLEINSANLVDIILDAEDEFDIAIDNDSMDRMVTVQDAVNLIETKRRGT